MKKRSDGRWVKKIKLPNGKSKYLYSSASSERLASKDFNEQMMKLEKKEEISQLFENVAEQWSNENFKNLENNTLKQYIPCYKASVEFFRGLHIKDIKAANISQYAKSLIASGYALKTVKNRLSVTNLIFKYALLNDYIEFNPCQNITLPKGLPQKKRQKATSEDEKKICEHTDSLCGVIAYLYLVTGCRRGEALALQPSDIDIDAMSIHITKTVEWIGNKPQIKKCPKTDAGIREIPINQKLIKLLQPYMNQKYIFQNINNEIISNSQFSKMWGKYQKEINISCTPHELRHSYATILFDAGIDVKTAQMWLGHSDINTTLGIYTHLSEQRQTESKKKIIDFLTTF